MLTQNYKAEYEKAAAAVITAVTKSGGNEFHGDVFYFFQDKDLVTQDDFSKSAQREGGRSTSAIQSGLSIGGPIVADRLHFFASYEENEQDRLVSIFRGSAFADAPANVQSLLSGFQTGTADRAVRVQALLRQALLAAGRRPDAARPAITCATSRRSAASAASARSTAPRASRSAPTRSSRATPGCSAMCSTRRRSPCSSCSGVRPPSSSGTPRLNYIGILDVGGKDATQDFVQDKIGLRDDVSFAADWHGAHTLKTGVSANWLDYEITKETFPNALFEFRSDEQWQFPFQARLGFGNPSLEFSNTQLGIYLQDDWQALPNVTRERGRALGLRDQHAEQRLPRPPAT